MTDFDKYFHFICPKVYVKNATGAPVLFWIHGGGFTSGSGNQYGAAELVKKNVVVVTFNYRLGSLGEQENHKELAKSFSRAKIKLR